MVDDLVRVGVITGAHGIKGDVRIKSFCADPAAIEDYNPLSDKSGSTRYLLKVLHPVKGGFAARLEGITTRNLAEDLKGTELFARKSAFPELEEDEYYYSDLIGLDVYDPGGKKLGRITAMHDFGAGDIVEIDGPELKTSLMLPFTDTAIPVVDLKNSRVIADIAAVQETGGNDG